LPGWFAGKPEANVAGVIVLSTVFVLWGIGGLMSGIEDLIERIGPPRQ